MVPSASGEEQKSALDANRFSVDRAAGLAGQYQVAYNPEENDPQKNGWRPGCSSVLLLRLREP